MLTEKHKQKITEIYNNDPESRRHFPTVEKQLKACEKYLKQEPLNEEQIDDLLSDYVIEEQRW
jgi:hypothetical protein